MYGRCNRVDRGHAAKPLHREASTPESDIDVVLLYPGILQTLLEGINHQVVAALVP